ncbi:MAG: nitronate monooxygenase [Myxococcales bacterium]|nr:nitronate monooxygenase [Myxococcales bacterium]
MTFSTPLSRRIGLRYPLVAAPMFIISNKEMLLACAEAGILGTMPSLNARTAEALREDILWVQARTDRPFGINMTIGLADPERRAHDAAICEELRVPVWITSYGDPTPFVAQAHGVGALVFHDVINRKHAEKAAAAGVDAIIGVAAGAGGHAGRISPFALVPYLRDHVGVPIIAAGCISTGRQVAAALVLGAELAYMGTRFIASAECGAPDAYKHAVVDADPEDIVYTDQVSGVHANFIASTVPDGFTPDRSPSGAKRWRDIWSAGHGVAEIHEVAPIADIVAGIVREYEEAVGSLPRD